MTWQKIDKAEVPTAVAKRLTRLLAEEQAVAWLVSGGSNVSLQVETMHLLQSSSADLSKLTVLLVDERFGAVGHIDSNWQQLRIAGFMIDGPRYIQPFTTKEKTLEAAVARYETVIQDVMGSNYTFAQLGMGDDGHISGILPSSPAVSAEGLVYAYIHEPFKRLTTTFSALKWLDEVALVVYGDNKWPQLAKLQTTVDPSEQPAQIIKDIPAVTIYTDYQAS